MRNEALGDAIEDLTQRTLTGLPGDVARLVYLASTRDYNTGRYYHEGLASEFSEELAAQALAACHEETFRRLVAGSLEDFVRTLDTYLASLGARRTEVLKAWQKLEAYRVTIPLDSEPLAAQLLFSNVRIGLAILGSRPEAISEG